MLSDEREVDRFSGRKPFDKFGRCRQSPNLAVLVPVYRRAIQHFVRGGQLA